jgi:hypothetical protein
VRADERAALGAFHALADEAGCSAVNAVGILNKADQIGAVDDPLGAASALAASHATALRAELAGVVPLVGLWAETAACGMLSEVDAATLRALANLDPALRCRLTASAATFLAIDVPASAGGNESA